MNILSLNWRGKTLPDSEHLWPDYRRQPYLLVTTATSATKLQLSQIFFSNLLIYLTYIHMELVITILRWELPTCCVWILYMKGVRPISWQFYFTFTVFGRNQQSKANRQRNIFLSYFALLNTEGLNWGLNSSNKPTHYVLDYGHHLRCLQNNSLSKRQCDRTPQEFSST